MFDLMKKTFFTSIGIACLTKEKVREAGKKYVEEAHLSEEEGRKFFDELLKKSDEARSALEKVISDTIEKILKKLAVPTRDEFSQLKDRVTELETTVKQKIQSQL